ncbi:MAG: hypothetical protein H7175_19825 [Burkholderiales bacterium]|nr:hypothetical protein [Anaerolineae bacterium]
MIDSHTPFALLTNWETTRDSLHQASKLLGAIRVAVAEPLPNSAQYSLNVTPRGISTGALPFGGDLLLDFIDRTVRYREDGKLVFAIPIEDHTQHSLTDTVLGALEAEGIKPPIKRDRLGGETRLTLDADIAAEYADTLYRIYTAMARFKARVGGPMSPLVLWPHHFDISFLWFATPQSDEHADPHMNFGFAPMSEGFDRPYFYAYAWPLPAGITDVALPTVARWHTTGWTGAIIDYDIAGRLGGAEGGPEGAVEALLYDIFKNVSPLLRP